MGHGGSVVYPWIICFKGRETPWIGCCQKLEPFGDAVLQLPLNCGRKLHEQKENTQTPHRMDRSFNALIEVLSWKPLPSQRRLLRPPLLALFSSSVLCIISLLNPNLQLCTFIHLLQWVDLARKTLTRSSTRSRSKLLSKFVQTYLQKLMICSSPLFATKPRLTIVVAHVLSVIYLSGSSSVVVKTI